MNNPTIKGAKEAAGYYATTTNYHRLILPDGRVMVGAVGIRHSVSFDYDQHAALERYAKGNGFNLAAGETDTRPRADVTIVIGGRPLYEGEAEVLLELFAGVAMMYPTKVINVRG